MKRIALAAALMAAFAGSAMAQSSVTLYGRINTSVEWQDNDQIDKTVMRNNASRWGLKGNEDLGGGLNAFFLLESGFDSDNGAQSQPGRMFGREAYVGLKSNSLGSVQAGKMFSALYYATIDYIGMFNHDTGTTSEDNIYSLRADLVNAVQYTSPSFGGFTFALTAAAGEGVVDKTYEGVVSYDNGPLHLAGGYSQSDDPAGNNTVKGFSLAGFYTFGAISAGLNWENSDAAVLGKRDQVTGTAMYAFGANELHLSVGWAGDWDNVPNSDALQYTIGYNYNLSKRTKLYAFYYAIDNGTFTYSGTANVPALPDKTFSSIGLGIRHNF